MEWGDVVNFFGFLIGSLLNISFLYHAFRRREKVFHEFVFLLLLTSLAIWHLGNFSATLLDLLFTDLTLSLTNSLREIGFYSLAFSPSLLIHAHASYFVHTRFRSKAVWLNLINIIFFVPPAILIKYSKYSVVTDISRSIHENLSFVSQLVMWIIVALFISGALSLLLSRIRKRPDWRKFFNINAWVLFGLSVGLGYFFVWGGTGAVSLDSYIRDMLMYSSVVPSIIFAYVVYKYSFYKFAIRKRMIYYGITAILLSAYLLLVNRIGSALAKNESVNSELVEIILIILSVFLFLALRDKIQKLIGRVFADLRFNYQRTLRSISEQISGVVGLDELYRVLKNALSASLGVETLGIFLVRRTRSTEVSTDIFEYITQYGRRPNLPVDEIMNGFDTRHEVYESRKSKRWPASDYEFFVPLHSNDEIIGFVGVGSKKTGEGFSLENKELLITIVNQFGIAIQNIELIKRRLELEARIFEAERFSALGQLSTSIAHEVKNPLSSIKAIVQSMKESKTEGDEELRDLRIINDEIDRLTQVVEQLLEYARPAGNHLNSADLGRVLENVLLVLRHQTRKNNITVYLDIPENDVFVRTDVGGLKEIAFNLIFNAIQAMNAGGVLQIRVRYADSPETHDENFVERLPDEACRWDADKLTAQPLRKKNPGNEDPESSGEHAYVVVEVRDTGAGIPEEIRQSIFKPFFTTKTTGTGLGLPTVKNKVELLGGKIFVSSKPGRGTVFTVFIPTTQVPGEESA